MKDIQILLNQLVERLYSVSVEAELSRPEEHFGDYSTNVAMRLAKVLGRPPLQIAQELATGLGNSMYIASATVAGPGFLNIKLKDEVLAGVIATIEAQGAAYGRPTQFQGRRVVIETNNPNPFKDIHIGHAFNSIVADTIANLIEVGGAEVHRVSYHGDVGLHVGKSLWAILDQLKTMSIEDFEATIESDRPRLLREWYARGAGLYEEDPDIKKQIDDLTTQSFDIKDPLVKAVYEICKYWSFSYFDYVFKRIGSKTVERRYLESETDKAGRATVDANMDSVFTRSNGAIVFVGEPYGLHTRVFITGRGNTLYEARDLGLVQLKAKDYDPDLSVIVTAEEQREYFKVVFKVVELTMPEAANKTVNMPTGTVKLTTGKMSSRTGTAVNIEWLFGVIEDAVKMRGASGDSLEPTIVAALRYAMLKNRYDSDTVFDVEQSVGLEGNTGPYLQYAYARARSIRQKSEASLDRPLNVFDADERSLARKISEYPEVLQVAVETLMPHHVCTYLYELAQCFNRFYEKNRVIGDTREIQRLKLIDAYTTVLSNGLGVLGIPIIEHM